MARHSQKPNRDATPTAVLRTAADGKTLIAPAAAMELPGGLPHGTDPASRPPDSTKLQRSYDRVQSRKFSWFGVRYETTEHVRYKNLPHPETKGDKRRFWLTAIQMV